MSKIFFELSGGSLINVNHITDIEVVDTKENDFGTVEIFSVKICLPTSSYTIDQSSWQLLREFLEREGYI